MAKASKRKGQQQMRRRPTYRVFVSHATPDKWIAKMMCERIESVGAEAFRDDRDIETGDDIPDEIRRALISSQELVILMTPVSVERPWVLMEAGAFWGQRKNARIIAVLCHVNAENIPDMIRSKKAIPINEFDVYLQELSIRIKGGTR
jgi:hypothetical protein